MIRLFGYRLLIAIKYYIYNSYLTNFPSYKFRTFYLRRVLKIKIGEGTSIHMGCFFAGNNIEIGSNTVVARNTYFDGRSGKIFVGNNVSIAPEVYILSLTHDPQSSDFSTIPKAVFIKDYAWICARVTILPGVEVGYGSVLGAASIITKNVEDYAIVAGAPAKKIGERTRELNYQLSYFPYFNGDI